MDQIQSLEWRCQEPLHLQGILDNYFSSTLNEYNYIEYPLDCVACFLYILLPSDFGRYRYVWSQHCTKNVKLNTGNAPRIICYPSWPLYLLIVLILKMFVKQKLFTYIDWRTYISWRNWDRNVRGNHSFPLCVRFLDAK